MTLPQNVPLFLSKKKNPVLTENYVQQKNTLATKSKMFDIPPIKILFIAKKLQQNYALFCQIKTRIRLV